MRPTPARPLASCDRARRQPQQLGAFGAGGLKETTHRQRVHLRGSLSNPSKGLRDLLSVGWRQPHFNKIAGQGLDVTERSELTQPNKKLSPTEIEELAARYRVGGTVRSLAADFGVHESTARRYLRRRGVVLRGPRYRDKR